MKRAIFDPNVHGLFVWPETWAAESLTALEQLSRELVIRYPGAIIVPAGSAAYAMRVDVVAGVAWIEPEFFEGRVIGVERYLGSAAGSA